MPSRKRERQLLEAMWARVEPLIPPHRAHPKGGRPFADDRDCFAGIVYQLRNGIRWNDMPECFPSGVTCWRRFDLWTRLKVWPKVWAVILDELQAAGLLDLSELAIDATFVEAQKGGDCSGPTKCGLGQKLELAVEGHGIPVSLAIDAANVPETALGPAALAMLMVLLPFAPVPVLADRAYDCDWLREHLASRGFILVAAHRSNRVKEPTNDGRTLRRLKRRWKVERTFAWLHSYRRVMVRYEKALFRYEGFANLACAFIALGNLL